LLELRLTAYSALKNKHETYHTLAIPMEVAFSSGTPWFILSPLSHIPKSYNIW